MPHTADPILALRGQVLSFTGDPGLEGAAAVQHWADGAVAMQAGRILAVGDGPSLARRYPGAEWRHHPDGLILPGFIDAHVHYPQLPIIGAWGEQLLDWLQRYTYPAELALADPEVARALAGHFLQACLQHGTTSAAVFCTVHPHSAEALFQAAEALDMRLVAGKVWMDRHAPAGLLDTARSAYDDSLRLARRWHGRGRAGYAITPRFAPTSSPGQLEAAGALAALMPELHVQTHLAESEAEQAWVRRLFPAARDYLEVYERHGLCGPRSLFGHGVQLEEAHWQRLHDAGAAVVHCPSSNLFLGSGLFDLAAARRAGRPVRLGLATDVGAGSSLSMLRTLGDAYRVAQLRGQVLEPLRAFYLATRAGAEALGLEDCIGSLAPGLEADVLVLDWAEPALLAWRAERAGALEALLFLLMMLGDERAVREVYLAGRRRWQRPAPGSPLPVCPGAV